MMKYHINPDTGRPNICNPKKTGLCKYAENGENPQHYSDKKEAQAAYETIAEEKFGSITTISKKPKFKKFIQPETVHRFVSSMHHEYDPAKIHEVSLSSHLDEYINCMNFDKPFGGLWFGTQEKVDVKEYGEYAPTNWAMLLGDGDEERDKINPKKGNYYTPELREEAKIIEITDRESYVNLLDNYGFIPIERFPNITHHVNGQKRKVDWEAFAKDYDGIFISQNAISENNYFSSKDRQFAEENATLDTWDIETLWICNSDVVNLRKIL